MLHANARQIFGETLSAFLFEQCAEIADAEARGGAYVLQGDGLAVMLLHVLLGDADGPERLAAAADILSFHVLFFKADQTIKQFIWTAGKACLARKSRFFPAVQPKAQREQAAR